MDETNENKKLYLFALRPKNPLVIKILTLSIALLVIIVSIEAVIYYRQLNKSNLYSNPPINVTKPDTDSAIVLVSNQIINWIKSQKSANGQYYLQNYCDNQKQSCQNSPDDSRIGINALWSHFIHYQIKKDTQDLIQIDNIIAYYNSPESVGVQANFWSCKILNEIWKSNILNDTQNEKIKKLCLQSTFYRPYASDLQINNPNINKYKFLDASFIVPDLFYQNYDASSYENNKSILYSAFSSDYVNRFLFSQDKKDLDDAQIYFNAAVITLRQQPKNTYINGRCVLGIAALDLYQATNNEDYLNFTKNFTENEGLDSYAQYINKTDSNIPKYFQNSVFERASCSILYHDIYKLTSDSKYKNYSSNLFSNIADKSFDKIAAFSFDDANYYYSLKENSLFLKSLQNNLP